MDVKIWQRAGWISAAGGILIGGIVCARGGEAVYTSDEEPSATLIIADDGAPETPASDATGDDPFVYVAADDEALAGSVASAPAATPTAQQTATADVAFVAAPSNEPSRAERPVFIADDNVAPASAYAPNSPFASSQYQQPLRRNSTLQLRSLGNKGRSLSDRFSGRYSNSLDAAPATAARSPQTQRPQGATAAKSTRTTRTSAAGPRNFANRPANELSARSDDARRPANVQRVAAAPRPLAKRTSAAPRQAATGDDATASQLVQAHQLSLHATSEKDYSEIIQLTSGPARVSEDGEQREFAVQLAAWALNRRGEARADEGQTELALADFQEALSIAPEHWRTLHNRAVTYAQHGRFAEAFDDVSRVIELNPDFAKAYANRATLYVQAGDLEKALEDYSAALKREPTLTTALIGRGRVGHMIGQLDQADEDFTTAIDGGAADAPLFCSRGDLRADLGKYADALADYARAIEIDETCAHAYRNGAWLLATCPDDKFRDGASAIEGAKQALELGYGERHATLDALAAAYACAGDFKQAIATEQQAIDVAPEDAAGDYEARLQLYEAGQPYRTAAVEE